ncbi:MAG: hypothetical protein ACXVB1_00120 [Pseudobdellovibrionaceae bacterium]
MADHGVVFQEAAHRLAQEVQVALFLGGHPRLAEAGQLLMRLLLGRHRRVIRPIPDQQLAQPTSSTQIQTQAADSLME